MECKFCGTTGVQGKFCNECGNPLTSPPRVCSGCGNTELIGKFCHECGHPTGGENACPACNAPDQNGSFCKVCGESLGHHSNKQEDIFEYELAGEFDRGKAFCRECGDFSARYRSPGVLVDYCSLCGKGASYLVFEE